MIIRRIADAIRQENWFTVVLEILIVVAGIVIGLQGDDWNSLRKDRRDEQHYLNRLHDEMLNAEKLSARLLNRRIERQAIAFEILETVFFDPQKTSLTESECFEVGSLHFFNIAVTGLSAAEELTASGRMDILSDTELRAALGALKQAQEATNTYIRIQNDVANDLGHLYPDLVSLEARFDDDLQEVSSTVTCDLPAMRQNRAFLNDLSNNVDAYDAYVRDGLYPWAEKMKLVHDLIDKNLNIQHDASATG
jgi:hypothetical protein